MKRLCLTVLGSLVLSSAIAGAQTGGSWQAAGKQGAVAAGGQGAVDAGLEILKAGGNAADSAAATILALTVTDSTSCCFGGEVPILVYNARRNVVEVIAGQGGAPKLATREYFAAKPEGIPAKGVESAAVPAALDACLVLLERHGTMSFAEVVAPSLRLLDAGGNAKGKEWYPDLARTLRKLVAAEKTAPHDRATGLRRVGDEFYRGSVAREIDAWSRANGGLLRYTDMASHATRVEDPVSVDYRGYQVAKCGAWTQGPYLLEALRLLEGFDLKGMGRDRPDAIHVMVESMKLAMADRDVFYADPLFEDVPLDRLLSRDYADKRRPLIDKERASLLQRPGDPRSGRPLLDEAEARVGLGSKANDTTTCVTADGAGNMVAATPSGWSGVVAGSTGVWLGTRLQSFNTWADHPNRIEPGKRPRITLTPTLIFKDGKPVSAISVAGGDNQDQMALQLVVNKIDFGLAPAESTTAPRFMTEHFLGSFRQTPPKLGSLRLNKSADDPAVAELKRRGHDVSVSPASLGAAPVMIDRNPLDGSLQAAGDPKTGRHAGAF